MRVSFHGAAVDVADRRILQPITAELAEHRIGIIGANGSGKSTLARLINGLNTPTEGRVEVDGLDVARRAKDVRKKVGLIFSDADNQIVMPTVAEDVAFSLRKHKLPREERDAKVAAALQWVGLEGHGDQSPHMLSGGEKQLLALASITVLEPELIIADEPTTLLDLRNRRIVARMFADLPQQMIVVTHDLDLVRDADRIICVDDGTIVDDSADPSLPSSTPAEVIDAYVSRM